MPQIDFISYCNKSDGLILSPSELLDRYFHGIPVKDRYGNPVSNSAIENAIAATQKEIENFLTIKVTKQIVEEDVSFYGMDFKAWGFTNTSLPVNKPLKMIGHLVDQKQIEFPKEWLSSKQTTTKQFNRQVFIIPNASKDGQITSTIVYYGLIPQIGMLGVQNIPHFWKISYVTGYDEVPADISEAIGKLAAINLFLIIGDLVLPPGLNSTSISIDGLSQNYNTQGGYQTRIKSYLESLKETLPRLKSIYKGIVFDTL